MPSGPPTDVKEDVVNSTSAQLLWYPPEEEEQNGKITFYTVVVTGIENTHLVQRNLISNSTLIDLLYLRPFSEYNVSIAANTAVGMGPFTATLTIFTPEDGEYNVTIATNTAVAFTCDI